MVGIPSTTYVFRELEYKFDENKLSLNDLSIYLSSGFSISFPLSSLNDLPNIGLLSILLSFPLYFPASRKIESPT